MSSFLILHSSLNCGAARAALRGVVFTLPNACTIEGQFLIDPSADIEIFRFKQVFQAWASVKWRMFTTNWLGNVCPQQEGESHSAVLNLIATLLASICSV